MPLAPLQRCRERGCRERQDGPRCALHELRSPRNHRGVPRQARGHGRDHDRRVREIQAAGVPCALRLPGCTGIATSSDYVVPGQWDGPTQPACLHCQRAQGASLARPR